MTSIAYVLGENDKRDAYKVAWTYGHKLGVSMAWWRLQGNVKVHGLDYALDALARGNCIFVWNHQTVYDDFALNALFYRPWSSRSYLYDERFFIYSMPDRRILNACNMTEETSRRMRCIPVNRTNPKESQRAFLEVRKVVRGGRAVSLHPEEGRTDGLSNQDKELIVAGKRHIRKISHRFLLIANNETTIVPLYGHYPLIEDMTKEWASSMSEPVRRVSGKAGQKYLPVVYTIGEGFRIPPDFEYRDEAMRENLRAYTQHRILTV